MKYFTLAVCLLAVVASMPFEVVEDEDGEQYYAVPVSRTKRQTNVGISNSGVSVGHQGTIVNTNAHKLDAGAYAGKNYASHGLRPDQLGGHLQYAHNPSGSTAFVGVDHARQLGTNVNAGLNYNVYQGRNFGVAMGGQYSRQFGGIFGTGRPDSALYMKMYGHY